MTDSNFRKNGGQSKKRGNKKYNGVRLDGADTILPTISVITITTVKWGLNKTNLSTILLALISLIKEY